MHSAKPVHRKKIYKKTGDIVTRNLLDETIIVPIKGDLADMQRIFSINPLAKFIWERIDGKSSINDLLDNIVEVYEVDAQQAEADLIEFLEGLQAAGLIVESPEHGLQAAHTG